MNETDKFFSSTAVIFQWAKSDKHTNKGKRINKEHKIVMNVLKKMKQDDMIKVRGKEGGLF